MYIEVPRLRDVAQTLAIQIPASYSSYTVTKTNNNNSNNRPN